MYNEYQIGGIAFYNPWSILNYAKKGILDNYWVKTSANFLVKEGLRKADRNFWLLVNAGYLMVERTLDTRTAVLRIPNEEVMSSTIKY